MTTTGSTGISRDTIRALLERSDRAVERAVTVLYEQQTADEQEAQTTSHKNGVGFSAFDAEILSSFAEQLKANRYNNPPGRILTMKQMALARRKVLRYVGQLTRLAEQKQAMDADLKMQEAARREAAIPENVEEANRLHADLLARMHQNVLPREEVA